MTPKRLCYTCGNRLKPHQKLYCRIECYRTPTKPMPCAFCKTVFQPDDNARKYCSVECYAHSKLTPIPKHRCQFCGGTFQKRSYPSKPAKFCSHKCGLKGQRRGRQAFTVAAV